MDWYSRYVLAWRLSNTLDSDFCVDALEEALSKGTPEIFNTDQGSQFTSEAFTWVLLQHSIQISMDGKGRCRDNVFVERLWRSLKYEDVYFRFYNEERLHQALGYRPPRELFESRGPLAGEADHTGETIVARQEPERRCFRDADVISYPWPDPDPRVMATSSMAGDSLNLAPALSKLLGPPYSAPILNSRIILCLHHRQDYQP